MPRAHGSTHSGKSREFAYTFMWNVRRQRFPQLGMEPKTDSVSYEGKDKDGKPVKVTYHRSQADRRAGGHRCELRQ